MKRIGLFLLTNLAVMAVLGVVLSILYSVFGVSTVDGAGGIDFVGLMIVSAVVGFGGSLISLAMSKFMAMRMTGAKVIKDPRTELEMWLVSTVKRQADAAGIGMPDVAIYDAPDVNAFATGARRNSALVAVSTGLLRNMSRDEAEAVLGHEIAHVANGDMVTLTLIQGVVNTFVVFLAHVIGRFVDKAVFKTENGHGPGFYIAYFVAQMVLGILASVIVMWFSRQREFRADQGGAQLAGKQKMIAALERLKAGTQPAQLPDEMKAMGINGGRSQLARLFMTHPPLEERIEALRRSA